MRAGRGFQRVLEALPRPAVRPGAPFLSAWLLDGEPFDERTLNRAYDDFCDLHVWRDLRGPGARTALVAVWLHSREAQEAELRIGNTGPVEVRHDAGVVARLTERRARRDGHAVGLELPAGWSRLELELESDGPPWGFYARVTDRRGEEPAGFTASLTGPGELVVDTTRLPAGFVSWPYVELANRRPEPRASAFRLLAGGGRPPYTWSGRDLPEGLALSARGDVTGTPAVPGKHRVAVEVTDSGGAKAERVIELDVAEPPTRWYEDAALTAFVHFDKPERVSAERWEQELAGFERHASDWAQRAAGAGAAAMVLTAKHHDSWANWPTEVSRSDGERARHSGVDTLGAARAACLEHGLRFGVYYSLVDNWHPGYPADMPDYLRFQYLQMEELIDRFEPSIVWLDGHWERPNAEWEYDSLVSLIHARAPSCVVANNPGRRTLDVSEFGRGDVDVRTFEGRSPTDHMPRPRGRGPNPRPLPAEKVSFTCNWWAPGDGPGQAGCTRNRDAREWLRSLSETVCAGATLQLGLGPGYPGAPSGAPPPGELHDGAARVLEEVGRWLGEGREEAFVGVRPGPLSGGWGGSARRGDVIWLHVRRPGRVALDGLHVERAALLPGGEELEIEPGGSLDLRAIEHDPAVTLVRLETQAVTRS